MRRVVEVIVNSSSGAGASKETREVLELEFAKYDLDVRFRFGANGEEVVRLAKSAGGSDADVIVGAGGDGTISAVASEAHKGRKTFGVLPMGTLNNFSKDLGIPQDIGEAIRVIADDHRASIDIAGVNGRLFVNNSSIGLYPRMVKKREQQQRLGHGKWRSAIWASLRIFRISPFLKVRIELEGETFLRKTPFVFVGNNEYEMELYNIGRRPRLDSGRLSVYFLHREGRWGIVLMIFHTITSRLRQWRDFEEVVTDSLTIQTRRKRLPVALDGEVAILDTPLEYAIIPHSLSVLVPKSVENQNA